MGLRISQSSATIAASAMQKSSRAIARSLERLSTGRAINSPQDGSAAYSMGVNFESQIRGLRQGNLNINSTQSLLETADSALSSQLDLVQRMREIAVQASSSTLSTTDRDQLSNELQGLLEEFTRITQSTEFNGSKLLDGSQLTRTIQIGADSGQSIDLNFDDLSASSVFQKTVGTGNFTVATTVSAIGNTGYLSRGDLNNDGHLDIVGGSKVVLGDGQGGFTQSSTTPILQANLVDFNSDGILDIVGTNATGSILYTQAGNGDGTFAQAQSSSNGFNNVWAKVADINSDGHEDIVTYSTGGANIGIKLGHGDGSFDAVVTRNIGAAGSAGPHFLEDFNGDGELDIGWANAGGFYFSAGNGRGDFAYGTQAISAGNQDSSIVTDMNNDGAPDVILYDSTGFTYLLSVYINNGQGAFTERGTIEESTLSNAFYKPAVGDFNGDGLKDLAVGIQGLYGISLYLGDGTGALSFSKTIATDLFPENGVYSDDLNEDGTDDLYLTNLSLAIRLNIGQEVSALTSFDLSTTSKAQSLLKILDDALITLTDSRASIGALHNRLESTASAQLLLSDSLAEAQAKLLDVDVALETADLVRNQILQQAQISVSAQANLQQQVVLKLLY